MGADRPTPPDVARRQGLSARRSLDAAVRAAHSRHIANTLGALEEVAGADIVGAYAATGDEVDLSGMWRALRTDGKALCLPRIDPGGSPTMEFAAWARGAELRPNRFGIGEPVGPPVGVEDLDVVLVPCVAVDRAGTRVGFGAGYYDRALGRLPAAEPAAGRPVLVGVAYEVQVVALIDARPWDVPLDIVVTEAGVNRPR
ncbi:MAG: 5-formyltetrahydrofolate cyclo-ligase [Actinomycetia bacterium]|jgi:5-formyltetrahydrofolate cyclo-ligase|nr:5-formyltetrahydrofolate cyclo-ligase [Actinomycetes bacterium]